MPTIEYKGFRIIPNIKYVWKKNPVSGHSYPDVIDAVGLTIDAGKGIHKGLIYTRKHTSIKKAKEEIDFVLKFPFRAY